MKSFELIQQAEEDLFDIWEYSYKKWGLEQADYYVDTLEKQCKTLIKGYVLIRPHEEIHPSLKSIPCQHHHIFFLHQKNEIPIILAFFYERMDFIERLKGRL